MIEVQNLTKEYEGKVEENLTGKTAEIIEV